MLDQKTRELVAIGAAVTAHCIPCLKYHTGKAREAGATAEEIRQAVAVGRTVRKGSAGEFDEAATAVLEG